MSEQSESERLDAEAQRRGKEWVQYEEMKRLAEIAWAAVLSSPSNVSIWDFARSAWMNAEAMYDESERRRPVE